jgi:hypothetical protein
VKTFFSHYVMRCSLAVLLLAAGVLAVQASSGELLGIESFRSKWP